MVEGRIILGTPIKYKVGDLSTINTNERAELIEAQPCVILKEATIEDYLASHAEHFPSWWLRIKLNSFGICYFYEVSMD